MSSDSGSWSYQPFITADCEGIWSKCTKYWTASMITEYRRIPYHSIEVGQEGTPWIFSSSIPGAIPGSLHLSTGRRKHIEWVISWRRYRSRHDWQLWVKTWLCLDKQTLKYNPDEDKLTCTWRMQRGQDLDLAGEAYQPSWSQKRRACKNLHKNLLLVDFWSIINNILKR